MDRRHGLWAVGWLLVAAMLSAMSLAGDMSGLPLCGGGACRSPLWRTYSMVLGVVPVSALGLAMLAAILLLRARGSSLAAGLLYAATGIAAYHVYLQAFVIRDWCLTCLGTATAIAMACAGEVWPAWAVAWRRAVVWAAFAFLAMNFVHHHGAERSVTAVERFLAASPGGTLDAMLEGAGPWEALDAMAAEGSDLAALVAAKSVGPGTAAVTLEVFTDLACPHCAQFEAETLPEIAQRYVSTGRVRLVLRSHPASGDRSQAAELVAHAAAFQGRYRQVRDAMLRWQSAWTGSDAGIMDVAGRVADVQRLERALAARRQSILRVVQADYQRARDLGLMAAPAFCLSAGDQSERFQGEGDLPGLLAAVDRWVAPASGLGK